MSECTRDVRNTRECPGNRCDAPETHGDCQSATGMALKHGCGTARHGTLRDTWNVCRGRELRRGSRHATAQRGRAGRATECRVCQRAARNHVEIHSVPLRSGESSKASRSHACVLGMAHPGTEGLGQAQREAAECSNAQKSRRSAGTTGDAWNVWEGCRKARRLHCTCGRRAERRGQASRAVVGTWIC